MSLKERIDADLKQAMLARDADMTQILRDLKSAFLYEEVARGARDTGLTDSEYERIIAREVKKRDESIVLYEQGGNADSASKEAAERDVLAVYLPQPLSDDELALVVDQVIDSMDDPQMGQVIGEIKSRVGTRADGSRIAQAVRGRLG